MEVLLKLYICLLSVVLCNVDFIEAKNTTVLCYMAAWASTRPDLGKFTVKDADTEHCTHVVYAFMTINETTSLIESVDPLIDLDEGGKGHAQLKQLKLLKKFNKNIKVLASIGGYSQGSVRFSKMARTSSLKSAFINSLIKFIGDWELDGIDICWQFPGQMADDRKNFVNLLKDIKKIFEPKGWILTVHILAKSHVIANGYDIRSISQIVDYINLAAVEYNGPWDRKTGIMAPLNSTNGNNVASMVDYVLDRGAIPSKVLLGLPTYGHAYIVQEKIQSDKYLRLFSDKAFVSQWTREPGIIAYNEMCTNLKNVSGWNEGFDEDSSTPIAFKDDLFVSYDNQKSLIEKAKLVNTHKLGGIMLWSLDMDDFHGLCHNKSYPLLSAVTEFLDRDIEQPSDHENRRLGASLPQNITQPSHHENRQLGASLPQNKTLSSKGGNQVYKIQTVNIVTMLISYIFYTMFS